MNFLGLNSPEILLISVIILSILGPKRVEKGWLSFQRLLKYLLKNDDNSSNVKPIFKVSDKKALETEEGKAVVETSDSETKTEDYNSNNVLVEITEEGEAKSEEKKLSDLTDAGKESKNKAGEKTVSKAIEQNTEVIAKAEEEKISENKKVVTKGRGKVRKTKKVNLK